MKIGIVGDVHFCQSSSIVRGNGEKYSIRLENCIKSINWAEQIFQLYNCDLEVFLGDFFDKSQLTAEEITAVNDIEFNGISKVFLVGNHEMWKSDLSTNSAHVLSRDNFNIITECRIWEYKNKDFSLVFLPYFVENSRHSFSSYLSECKTKNKFVFSHNDIAGITLGHFVSKQGFSLDEIKNNCTYFFNGHLHNRQKLARNVFNVGNLTGQNFSEDGFRYNHCIYIFDTETLSVQEFNNPFAIYFYKLDQINQLDYIEPNSVVTIKCKSTEYDSWKSALEKHNNKILTYKFILQPIKQGQMETTANIQLLAMDHLAEFRQYVSKQFGQDKYILHELEVLCT